MSGVCESVSGEKEVELDMFEWVCAYICVCVSFDYLGMLVCVCMCVCVTM